MNKGSILFDNYEIKEMIYESLQTGIYRALSRKDNKLYILKLLNEKFPSQESIARFKREYDIAKKINSNYVIKVFEQKKYENSLIIIMEDFSARSLSKVIKEKELSLEKLLDISIKIIKGLNEIHKAGIIHKDINPSNILLGENLEELKIIDFGISTSFNEEIKADRSNTILEGSLSYISPEQSGRINRSIDYRADYYSLGISLYEVFSKKLPFNYDDSLELIHAHIAKQAEKLINLNEELPKLLSDIIMKLIEKNPEDRYSSTYILLKDLNRIKENQNEDFEIAKNDVSSIFKIPEKLYGREKEIKLLKTSFKKILKGKRGFVFISGEAGSGKTSLVSELDKEIFMKNGLFSRGTFELLKRSTPYLAIINIFKNLIEDIISEKKDNLNQWKEDILFALRGNVSIIANILPEIELIIGEQKKDNVSSIEEVENRFNIAFKNLIKVFAKEEHPLILFLDDLQWADLPSINLIRNFLEDEEIKNILFLFAYRNNEVNDLDPFIKLKNDLIKENLEFCDIKVSNIELENIKDMLKDSLKLKEVERLAEVSLKKTKGNPFYLKQFINNLNYKKVIYFDYNKGKWVCNIDGVNNENLTENTIEFLLEKLKKIDKSLIEYLKIASCIGKEFDFKRLNFLIKEDSLILVEGLENLIKENLIVHSNKNNNLEKYIDINNLKYKFLHDKIKEAVYAFFEEGEKEKIHYKIAKFELAESGKEKKIFEIANHFKNSLKVIKEEDRLTVARLNFKAGKKAGNSAAYEIAVEYLEISLKLFGNNLWEEDYDLALELNTELSSFLYSNVNFEKMNFYCEEIIRNSKDILDSMKAYKVKIQAFIAKNDVLSAVEIALFVLKKLGIKIPKKPNNIQIVKGVLEILIKIPRKNIKKLNDLENMTDENKKAAMEIIVSISAGAYTASPILFLYLTMKQVLMSKKYGNTLASPTVYAHFALIISAIFGKIAYGYELGELAGRISNKFEKRDIRINTLFALNSCTRYWRNHPENLIKELNNNYYLALDLGNLEYSAYFYASAVYYRYFIGENLESFNKDLDLTWVKLTKLKQKTQENFAMLYRESVKILIQKRKSNYEYKLVDEEVFLEKQLETEDFHTMSNFYLLKLLHSYLFGNYKDAYFYAKEGKKYIAGITGFYNGIVYTFYETLSYISIYKDIKSKTEKLSLDFKIKANIKKYKKYSDESPMNFSQKYYLLKAEYFRLKGKETESLVNYKLAIEKASENNFINDEAISYELIAKYYFLKNDEDLGSFYITKSHYTYSMWGLKAKQDEIEKKYKINKRSRIFLNNAEEENKSTRVTNSSHFDLESIVKASHTLAREIKFENLLTEMMKIVIESAGAERGYFLSEKKGELCAEVEGEIENEEVVIFKARDLNSCLEPHLSSKIVNYTKRTGRAVVIENVAEDKRFNNDKYFVENKVKSVLCVAISNQGKFIGILYLENNLIKGAFNKSRLKILDTLSSQIAISIENAKMYQELNDLNINLENKVEARTKKLRETLENLKKTQNQLVETEKMVALGQLVAGVAHEINTPLGAINSSVAIVRKNLKMTLKKLPELLVNLSNKDKNNFYELLDLSINKDINISSKEERKLKRALIIKLDEYDFEDSMFLADSLIDLGLYDGVEKYIEFFRSRNKDEVLEMIYKISSLYRSIKTIDIASSRASKVVFALKTFSHYNNTEEMIETDIKEGMETVLTLYSNKLKQNINLERHYSEIPKIYCYPDELSQVWTNIIHNSLQAMNNKGNLNISILKEENFVRVDISDSGPGIPDEIKEKIFKPFFTTKAQGEGSGLGLDIVKKIIDKHNGKITLDSIPGKTTFSIYLKIGRKEKDEQKSNTFSG